MVKTVKNNNHVENAKSTYELLCDVETSLGFACVLPCLETMQRLSELAQGWDIQRFKMHMR